MADDGEKSETNSLVQSETVLDMDKDNKQTRIIEVKIEFLSIGEVDTMNEKYQAEVKITAKWFETEDIVKYNRKKNWNPKLYIENALHDLKEDIKYKVTKVENKTVITEIRFCKGLNFKFRKIMCTISYY
jgi:hypothetical protein